MTAEYIYVARNSSDNSLRGYVFDDKGYEKSTSQSVAKWIRDKCIVERLPANKETFAKLKFTVESECTEEDA